VPDVNCKPRAKQTDVPSRVGFPDTRNLLNFWAEVDLEVCRRAIRGKRPASATPSTLALARRRVPHLINFPQLCDES
jgi:hypothetical protein